jgi:hypothetical protein
MCDVKVENLLELLLRKSCIHNFLFLYLRLADPNCGRAS